MVFLIALTGGIAAGKSTVAKLFSEHGAETIDADEVAREVVKPGTLGLDQITKEFSTAVLDRYGNLDRAKLAELVFSDSKKRMRLESILHPLIRERTQELFRKSDKRIVIYSVPLLVESGVNHDFDFVITVEAGKANQLKRLLEQRGMSESEAISRIDAQATEEQRRKRADWVIDSSGSLSEVREQVSELWKKIEQLAQEKESRGAN
ncbi:MAG: dephospho-CoA kinase [Actinomycetota bacterium]